MNKSKFTVAAIAITLSLAFTTNSWADRVEMRGIATVSLTDSSDKGFNTAKQQALNQAKLSAWKNYVASQNSSQQQIIAKNQDLFLQNLDGFIIDSILIEASKDTNAQTVRVVNRFVFNDEAIAQLIQKVTVGGSAQSGARSSDSTFSFIFMARSQSQVKQFDARRTDVSRATAAVTTAADRAVSSEVTTQTGGNTTTKADEVTYAVSSSEDLNTAMGEVLTASAGIEYTEYNDVVASCNGIPQKSFMNEYATSDEMSAKTRAAIISALRKCEIRYFSTGTIDTLMPARDPITGGIQGFVTVRAQLWDISGKLPKKIGSVGPKQFSALGAKPEIAGKNALVLAAKETAKALVDQLNSKGIR